MSLARTGSDSPDLAPAASEPALRRMRRFGAILLGPTLLVLVCIARAPDVMGRGRFWAEEGTVFFSTFESQNLLNDLAYVYKGHLEILANISVALSLMVPLKIAPLVTVYFGLICQILASLFVSVNRTHLGLSTLGSLLLSLFIVTSPDGTESFLNTTNVQWTASIILFFLISMPPDSIARRQLLYCIGSLVLGLSGIAALILVPVAYGHALIRASRPHLWLAFALTLALCLQAALLLHFGVEGRHKPTDPYLYLTASFLQIVVKPMLGVEPTGYLGDGLRSGSLWSVPTIVVPPFVIVLSLAYLIASRRVTRVTALAIGSLFFVTAVNVYGSLGDPSFLIGVAGLRYFYLPSVIAFYLLARQYRASQRNLVCTALLCTVSLVSLLDFFFHTWPESITEDTPVWQQEISKCLPDTPCTVKISPPDWSLTLPGRRW